MKTTMHTIEYYARNEEKFVGKRGIVNPEKELANKLSALVREAFSNEQWETITQVFAKQVVNTVTAQLLEDKKLYQKVRKTPSCLGYTTKLQETQEAARIVTIFEYNCYKLSQFKKKYDLQNVD